MGAKPTNEKVLGQLGEVSDRRHAVLDQRPARGRADAPQPLDAQRREERGFLAARDDDQPVGLAQVTGNLGHEPIRRDTDRHGQLRLVVDSLLQLLGGLLAVAEELLRAGQIEERLVDRERLDQRREAPEDGHDLLAHGVVLGTVDGHEDALRAERAGRAQRHGRAHAELARLVGGRADDAAVVGAATADDDRLAAQRRVVALLDGRKERVEVRMQDRPGRRARHATIMRRCQWQLACHFTSAVGTSTTCTAGRQRTRQGRRHSVASRREPSSSKCASGSPQRHPGTSPTTR